MVPAHLIGVIFYKVQDCDLHAPRERHNMLAELVSCQFDAKATSGSLWVDSVLKRLIHDVPPMRVIVRPPSGTEYPHLERKFCASVDGIHKRRLVEQKLPEAARPVNQIEFVVRLHQLR